METRDCLASPFWHWVLVALDDQRRHLRAENRGLSLLAESSRQVAQAGSESEEELLETAAHVTAAFLDASRAYVFTGDYQMLYGSAASDPAENETLRQIKIPLNRHSALTEMYAARAAVTLTGRALAELAHHWPDLQSVESLHLVPLMGSTGRMGALAIIGAADLKLTSQQLEFLDILGAHVALVVEKNRIASWAAEEYSRADERSDEFESFLYAASHDLKAPIVSLQAFAQLLQSEYASLPEKEALYYIERIESNACRMHRLVRDLLEYARAGELEEAGGRVDVEALVNEVVAEMADTIAANEGSVKIAKQLPTLLGDPTRLREVFRNLLENALLYGGPRPKIEVGGCRKGGQARLWVSDSGSGISPDWQERVFKPSARDPRATETHPEGTGMGLAIVKKIVEWHGGRIWVESADGQGAAFYFILPLYSEETT